MRRLLASYFIICISCFTTFAQQVADSIPPSQDTVRVLTDSAAVIDSGAITIDSIQPPVATGPDTTLSSFYRLNPNIPERPTTIVQQDIPFAPRGRDTVFYVLAGLLLLLGLIRIIFSKYFNDLFRIFFQTSLRQKSLREQLLQNTTASLMMNIFFFISGGLFLYFLAVYKGWLDQASFIEDGLLCVGFIAAMYSIKYVGLRISGWLFGMGEVMDTYLFIVFLVNKIIGVMLLPAIVILAVGAKNLQPVLMAAALLMLIIVYLYRYIVALPLFRSHSGLTGFHFFIYLCAFEIVPVLIIYKVLLLIISR